MFALKYRPHCFSELEGQIHVVIVLKAILRKYFTGIIDLPAGFLLAGTRGSGKTSTARIIAAALNCPNCGIEDVDKSIVVEPCGVCSNCLSVQKTTCFFVHEIDAASSGLVDDIRKLKDTAMYAHSGQVRVFVLDEAHSLTRQAFEALLKQLEEPVPNTLFVMCTTEPEKFPNTVLSRLMRFDFKQITPDVIVKRLLYISEQEHLLIKDTKILIAIAQKAQGSMRDAIMMLEQLSNYKEQLTLSDFYDYYGLVDSVLYTEMLSVARKADVKKAKMLIEQYFSRGVDVAYFIDGFMRMLSDELVNDNLSHDQVILLYRAAVEVKGKLKFITPETAAYFLFALMLKVFYGSAIHADKQVADSSDLTNIFGVG